MTCILHQHSMHITAHRTLTTRRAQNRCPGGADADGAEPSLPPPNCSGNIFCAERIAIAGGFPSQGKIARLSGGGRTLSGPQRSPRFLPASETAIAVAGKSRHLVHSGEGAGQLGYWIQLGYRILLGIFLLVCSFKSQNSCSQLLFSLSSGTDKRNPRLQGQNGIASEPRRLHEPLTVLNSPRTLWNHIKHQRVLQFFHRC